jgi:hypothetical protein
MASPLCHSSTIAQSLEQEIKIDFSARSMVYIGVSQLERLRLQPFPMASVSEIILHCPHTIPHNV